MLTPSTSSFLILMFSVMFKHWSVTKLVLRELNCIFLFKTVKLGMITLQLLSVLALISSHIFTVSQPRVSLPNRTEIGGVQGQVPNTCISYWIDIYRFEKPHFTAWLHLKQWKTQPLAIHRGNSHDMPTQTNKLCLRDAKEYNTTAIKDHIKHKHEIPFWWHI